MTTIRIRGRDLDMPGATTVGYAAMRAAQEFGHDPEDPRFEWSLTMLTPMGRAPLDSDDVIGEFDGQTMELTSRLRPGYTSDF